MGVLDGQVAVISSGTSGIGARAAELFVNEGVRVVIAGRRRKRGEQLAAKLVTAASFIRTDVSLEHAVAAVIQHAVNCFGRLDCLLNTAATRRLAVASPTSTYRALTPRWASMWEAYCLA